jgi:hypothetical protein
MRHVSKGASTNARKLDKITAATSYVIVVGLVFLAIICLSSGPLHILWQ